MINDNTGSSLTLDVSCPCLRRRLIRGRSRSQTEKSHRLSCQRVVFYLKCVYVATRAVKTDTGLAFLKMCYPGVDMH